MFVLLHDRRNQGEISAVVDAVASESLDAHNAAVQRMVQAGVVPCSWMQTISEWMHSWQNPKAGEMYTKVYMAYNGYFGQKRPE